MHRTARYAMTRAAGWFSALDAQASRSRRVIADLESIGLLTPAQAAEQRDRPRRATFQAHAERAPRLP